MPQKAKQFAAQQVIAFLGASQRGRPPAFSPPNGSANANTNNGLSHPSAFSNKRRRPSSSTSSPQPASRTPDRHGRFLSSSSSLSSSSVTPVATKEAVRDLSVFEYVRSLADELGLENPTYHLASEAELPDFWSGRPIFKAGSKVPDGVGAVREVLGKQNAKVQTAQKTLAWLQGEKQRRQAELAAILQSLKSQ